MTYYLIFKILRWCSVHNMYMNTLYNKILKIFYANGLNIFENLCRALTKRSNSRLSWDESKSKIDLFLIGFGCVPETKLGTKCFSL